MGITGGLRLPVSDLSFMFTPHHLPHLFVLGSEEKMDGTLTR